MIACKYTTKICLKHVPSKSQVRPHSNNTSKEYAILITRGWWKHLPYAVILILNFQDLGFLCETRIPKNLMVDYHFPHQHSHRFSAPIPLTNQKLSMLMKYIFYPHYTPAYPHFNPSYPHKVAAFTSHWIHDSIIQPTHPLHPLCDTDYRQLVQLQLAKPGRKVGLRLL